MSGVEIERLTLVGRKTVKLANVYERRQDDGNVFGTLQYDGENDIRWRSGVGIPEPIFVLGPGYGPVRIYKSAIKIGKTVQQIGVQDISENKDNSIRYTRCFYILFCLDQMQRFDFYTNDLSCYFRKRDGGKSSSCTGLQDAAFRKPAGEVVGKPAINPHDKSIPISNVIAAEFLLYFLSINLHHTPPNSPLFDNEKYYPSDPRQVSSWHCGPTEQPPETSQLVNSLESNRTDFIGIAGTVGQGG